MSTAPLLLRNASLPRLRSLYLQLLTWGFVGFNSLRIISYVPTLWAIHSSGDSTQHSLLTWLTWFGANLTMAGWMYENSGNKMSKPIAVNLCNSVMCAAAIALIAWYRA